VWDMKYDMLFCNTGKQYNKNIHKSIKDLKIEDFFMHFLPLTEADNVIRILTAAACEETIRERQKIFSFLECYKIDNYFTALLTQLASISRLHKSYAKANEPLTKQVLFLSLMENYVCLCDEIISGETGFADIKLILKCIGDFKVIINTDRFKSLKDDINIINEMFYKNKEVKVTLDTMESYFSSFSLYKDDSISLADKMKKIQNKFNIKKTEKITPTSRDMSNDFKKAYTSQHPEIVAKLSGFYNTYVSLFDPNILILQPQMEFYLSMNKIKNILLDKNIPVCIPKIVNKTNVMIKSCYDISLLTKNVTQIIPNDIKFDESEAFYVLTGKNGGGKTTYIRSIGFAFFLFMGGFYICADYADMCVIDGIFTHFTENEGFNNYGRHSNETIRMNEIKAATTGDSLVLLNEPFSSTTDENSVAHIIDCLKTLTKTGAIGVLATHNYKTKGFVKEINHDNKSKIGLLSIGTNDNGKENIYKITKQENTNLSMAENILCKYNLHHEGINDKKAEIKRRWENGI
jgi:ABC-type lipoprotein export system ATPase subunit